MGTSGSEQKHVVRSLLVISLEYVAHYADVYGIASLPRRLRINVLRHLRVLDLCRAEAVDGMCADFDAIYCVWSLVGERQIHLGEPMGISIPLRDLEDMFHSVGDRRLTWNDNEWVLEMSKMAGEYSKEKILNAVSSCLLSSQEMLRNAAISALFTSGVSSRDDAKTRQFPARMWSEEYLLTVLLHECLFLPSAVYIDCTDTIYSGLWTRRGTSFPILRWALRRVKQLTISLTGPCRNASRVTAVNKTDVMLLFRFILEAVFADDDNESPRVTHVTLKGDIGCLSEALDDHLCQFLVHQDSAVVPIFANSPLTFGYGGIEFFSIELNVDGLGRDAQVADRFHWNLKRIVSYQRRLKNLRLVGWCTTVPRSARAEYESFVETIAKLFWRPNFLSLLLEMSLFRSAGGYEENLSCVLREFLTSPVGGQTLKAFCVNGSSPLSFSDFCRNHHQQSDAESGAHVIRRRTNAAEMLPIPSRVEKHLYVIDEDVRVWFDHFATLNHPICGNLVEMVLDGVDGISDDTLAALAPLRLKIFNISNTGTDLMDGVSVEALVKVFEMPTLEEITLFDVVCDGLILSSITQNPPNTLAMALMRGVWKRVAVGNLLRLDFSRNSLGTVKFRYLREMFQGLFAFRQLSRTSVFLHDNNFKKEHFELMWRTWQAGAENRRLLHLGASSVRRETQTHTQCKKLDNIAYLIT